MKKWFVETRRNLTDLHILLNNLEAQNCVIFSVQHIENPHFSDRHLLIIYYKEVKDEEIKP